jgi:hypothetical protein
LIEPLWFDPSLGLRLPGLLAVEVESFQEIFDLFAKEV